MRRLTALKSISAVLVAAILLQVQIDRPRAAPPVASSQPTVSSPCAVREGFVHVPGGQVWYRIVGSGGAVPLLVAIAARTLGRRFSQRAP